ncbi:helix-turn-helix domain-containing protein [Candidatus Omnitrophota bacterium]
MKTIGEKLRQARLEQNLTLEEVYRQTKVHPQVLEALEQDRAHNFLSFVYIKGFLRKYAQFLGLDVDQLLKQYLGSQKKEKEVTPEPEPEQETVEKGKTASGPAVNRVLIIRAVFSILLLIGLIVYFRYVSRVISDAGPARIPEVRVEVLPVAFESAQKTLNLQVRTKEECWIKVETDGQVVFQQTLAKAKLESWRAREKIELRIGKPEALELSVNGELLDLAKLKVKKGLVITRQGIQAK